MTGNRETRRLSRAALAFRAAHAAFAVAQLTALGYVWGSALTGRRDGATAASAGFLFVEAGALIVGRGNCPMGPFQARLGDPVPLFELVLPPRAAKAAIPVLAAIAVAGIAALVILPSNQERLSDRRSPRWASGAGSRRWLEVTTARGRTQAAAGP
jgi:hypothetical protein